MRLTTDSATTLNIETDPGSTDLAPSEMIMVDTMNGRVEITTCNGGLVVEVYEPFTNTPVGLLHTSMGEGLSALDLISDDEAARFGGVEVSASR